MSNQIQNSGKRGRVHSNHPYKYLTDKNYRKEKLIEFKDREIKQFKKCYIY